MPKTKLRAAAVFSDNMVLQRDKEIAFFGVGQTGRTVTVSLDEATACVIVENENWMLFLPPHAAGGPYSVTMTDGEETIRFENVLIGEVWLAGGQSNMELELQNCLNGKVELLHSGNSQIRFYNVPKIDFVGEELYQAENNARWNECGPDTAAAMSAVAFFCARSLQAELHVPIGIIDCYKGGTSISCWMSNEQLGRSAAGQKYLDTYTALAGDKTDAQYEAELSTYNQEFGAWDARVKVALAKDPDIPWERLNVECGRCPWPPPVGKKSPYRPAGLYETMTRRVEPVTLRGFLYYQGEEDEKRCEDYGEMMVYLIEQWRRDWGDDTLPFVFVQLPMFISKTDYDSGTDSRQWCVLREKQWRVSTMVRNTALAVIIDCGDFDNIHPLDKQTVGKRLALQVLGKVYGKAVAADGPAFNSALVQGSLMRVSFHHAQGLCFDGGEGLGFELAAQDGVYFPAKAEIDQNTVVLSCEHVQAPYFVRYAWVSWGKATLRNGAGLPAAPFRSRATLRWACAQP